MVKQTILGSIALLAFVIILQWGKGFANLEPKNILFALILIPIFSFLITFKYKARADYREKRRKENKKTFIREAAQKAREREENR